MTTSADRQRWLGWFGIFRLGLVQTALGAIVVLMTSTLNRVMVVEHALPAMLPGVLVALHYVVQLSRPRMGYGSDVGGRRTPWVLGGIAVLALGGFLAAVATVLMGTQVLTGIAVAVLAYTLVGAGVGAAGTSLLALLAKQVHESRRAAAASIVWLMMIAGFVVTAGVAGAWLEPFSDARLLAVVGSVSLIAVAVAAVGILGVERDTPATPAAQRAIVPSFRTALRETWADSRARRFAVFVFVSMLAYNAQDLILEPFAGAVFGMSVKESTQLGGMQHGGVFVGMLLTGAVASFPRFRTINALRNWAIAGCIGSAAMLFALGIASTHGVGWPLAANVFALGFFNGVFAIAALSSMMALAGKGQPRREGMRVGLWGAAQAIAFGLAGFIGTAALDLARALFGNPVSAYASVFIAEALTFLVAGVLAARVSRSLDEPESTVPPTSSDVPGTPPKTQHGIATA